MILGVDGGNSKTEALVVALDGEPLDAAGAPPAAAARLRAAFETEVPVSSA